MADENSRRLTPAEAAAVWDEMDEKGDEVVMGDAPSDQAEDRDDDRAGDDEQGDDRREEERDEPAREPAKSATVADQGGGDDITALKKMIHDLQQRDVARDQELKRTVGRVASLQSALDKAKNPPEPPKSPTQRLSKRPDTWQRVSEDFPDIAAGAEELIDAVLGSTNPAPEELQSKVSVLLESHQNLANELQSTRDLLVEFRHQDWKTTVKSADFVKWRQAQPQEVNALGASDDPRDAIRMLDLYQSWKGTQPDPTTVQRNRQSRLEGAAGPAIAGSARVQVKPDHLKTKEEIWAEMDREDAERSRRR